jgi:hypothetical protein
MVWWRSSYEPGTLKGRLVSNCAYDAHYPKGCPEECYKEPFCELPHSCDEWEIGGVEGAKALIVDLQRFISDAEAGNLKR